MSVCLSISVYVASIDDILDAGIVETAPSSNCILPLIISWRSIVAAKHHSAIGGGGDKISRA